MTRAEKLVRLARFQGLDGIAKAKGWTFVLPDEHGDWLGQRDSRFASFLAIADKGKNRTAQAIRNLFIGPKHK